MSAEEEMRRTASATTNDQAGGTGGAGPATSATTNAPPPAAPPQQPNSSPVFTVGQLVQVESRTWPGINQPGGVGRITGVGGGGQQRRVSVKYVIDGRHEKEIAVQYVRPHSFDNNSSKGGGLLRDRSMLLGRCSHCGSLRTDCGSCDVWVQQLEEQQPRRATTTRRRQRKQSDENSQEEEEDMSDSEDSVDIDALMEQHRRQFQKYKRMKAKARRFFASVEIANSSSSSEDEGATKAKKKKKVSRQKARPTKPVESSLLVAVAGATKAEDDSDSSLKTTTSSTEDDDDDEAENDQLQQLALQSSQMELIQSSPATQRINTTGNIMSKKRTRSARRREEQLARRRRRIEMIRRGRRAILESSSSTSESEDGRLRRAAAAASRRVRSTTIDNEGGTLAATAAVAAASAAPASEDHQDATCTIDEDKIGEDEVEESAVENDNTTMDEDVGKGFDNNNDESDDFLFGNDDDDDMNYEREMPVREVDDDGIFIQPEGNAEQLPRDIHDSTANMEYPELTPFFDETVQKLEQEDIPSYKRQLLQLEREWRDFQNAKTSGEDSTTDVQNSEALKQRSLKLHDDIIQTLVRAGLDQCQRALRKLSSRRFYKQYRKRVSEKASLLPFAEQDSREFRLDAVGQAVEELIARLRYFTESLLSDDDADDDPLDGESASSREGWADPSDQSPSQRPFGAESQRGAMDEQSRNSSEPVDLHPYARKKRRTKTVIIDKRKSKAGRKDAARPHRRSANGGHSNGAHDRVIRTGAGGSDGRRISRRENSGGSTTDVDGESDDSTSAVQLHERAPEPFCRTTTMERGKSITRRAGIPTERSKARPKKDRERRRNVLTTVECSEHADLATHNIPDIENILPNLSSGGGAGLNTGRSMEQLGDREAISDRMQRWINANTRHDVGSDDNTTDDRLQEQSSKSKRTTGRPSTGHNQPGTSSTREEISYPQALTVAREEVFASLNRRISLPISDVRDMPSSEHTLQSLCASLDKTDSLAAFTRALNDICSKVSSDSTVPAPLVFRTLLTCLSRYGSRELQDLVSSESLLLEKHVSVLVALLRLLKLEVNKTLSPGDDGVLYEIFGEPNSFRFTDFVLLQLVDSVMALVLPSAWGLRVKDPRSILRKLEPLRNACALHFQLTERVCRCLTRELGKQEWRCVRNGEHIYVSTIDPDHWSSFLSSGKLPSASVEVRHAAFPKPFPRCEVEAVWFLLAYFAVPKALTKSTECNRWHFVSQCITQGSLCGCEKAGTLPPCKKQLDAVVEDLSSLTGLIVTGSLEDLPRRDNVLLDILRRALLLQSDDIYRNEESRVSFHPSVGSVGDGADDKKLAFQVWSGLWPPSGTDCSLQSSVATALCEKDCDLHWMGQPLVLPSSRILRCCLGLLVAWAERIPAEKAKRLQCFENVMKALVKSLTDDLDSTGEPDAGADSQSGFDAFQEAFSLQTVPDKCGKADTRRFLFRTESAAYITIFATSVTGPKINRTGEQALSSHLLSPSLAQYKHMWSLVSDTAMIKRQRWIEFDNSRSRPVETFQGDTFRLYLASKVTSVLALSVLGTLPLLGEAFAVSPSNSVPTGLSDYQSSALTFLLSCLISCLDCSCDSQNTLEIMSSIAISVGVVLAHISQRHKDTQRGKFGTTVVRMLSDSCVLQRAFHVVTSSSYCGVEEDLCFQALLAIVRRATALLPNSDIASAAPGMSVNNSEQAGSDDEFGDIDDALLASIDLGRSETKIEGTQLYNLLVDALLQSKPSSRNALFHPDARGDATTMSSQGMKLVGKRSDPICHTLAGIVASRDHLETSMKKPWIVPIRFTSFNDQGDAAYYKTIGRLLSRHLCSQHESKAVVDAVRESMEDILFNLFENLLDTKLLQKVPSCNLSRIAENSGPAGEEKGFTQLMSFKNGLPKSLCDSMGDLRSFCSNLGRLLIGVDKGAVGALLTDFDRNATAQLVDSIERECFDRFLLFRDIVGQVGLANNESFSVERVSSLLLASFSSELSRLLRKIGIQDQAHRDISQESYSRARLFETVSCFAETFVSWMAVVFRDLGNRCSAEFTRVLTNISEGLIAPLLQGRNLDLLSCLDDIVAQSSAFLAGHNPGGRRMHSSPSCDLRPYCNLLRNCLARRSREFLLFASESQSTTLLDAILSLECDERFAQSISRSFISNTYHQIIDESDRNDSAFPLQAAIENAFNDEEEFRSLSADQLRSLAKLKFYALEKILIPKLDSIGLEPTKRSGALRLVRNLLDIENIERSTLEYPLILCSLAKSIITSIRVAFQSNAVDEELVKACFACARSLINIPAACVESQAIGWLIDWVCSSHETTNISANAGSTNNSSRFSQATVDDEGRLLPPKLLHARYLWYLCLWLKDLGDILLDSNVDTIHTTRVKLRDDQYKDASGFAAWPPIRTLDDRSTLQGCLIGLEEHLFPVARFDGGQNIVNVYRRTKSKASTTAAVDTGGALVRWVPGLALRSTVSLFSTKVKSASFVGSDFVRGD